MNESDKLTIFDVPTGERCTVFDVDVHIHNTGQQSHFPIFEATATKQIRYFEGAWRRLLIDCSVEFSPGDRTIWLGHTKRIMRLIQDERSKKKVSE